MPYIKAVTKSFRLPSGKVLLKGEAASVSDAYVIALGGRIENGDISVHPENPNKKKTPRRKKKAE